MEEFIADNQIVTLQTQITVLNAQVAALQATNAELQIKCAFLNGTIFTGDLKILGTINQVSVSPIGANIFLNSVSINSNLYITGSTYSLNASLSNLL